VLEYVFSIIVAFCVGYVSSVLVKRLAGRSLFNMICFVLIVM